MKNQVEDTIRSISASATAVFGSVAFFGQGILRQGIASAAAFETTTVEMETLLGSAEETKKTLAALTEFAVKTPFEMPGILRVATGMIQFGERGEELMQTMNMLADASGGTPEKFQILGLVLNQVRGVGKLLTQDFRQLSSRGIISLQDLANYFGVTANKAQDMISKGKVSFDDFKKMLIGLTKEGQRYYKMSERQSQTLAGLNSTFVDAKNIMYRFLAAPLVPYLKAALTQMIKVVEAMGAFVEKSGKMVGAAFAGGTGFAMLGTAIAGATVALRLFGLTWKSVIIGTGIGAVFVGIGAVLGAVVAKLSESEEAMRGLGEIAENFGVLFQTVFTGIGQLLNDVFGLNIKTANDFFNAIVDGLKEVIDWISLMSTNWKLTWQLMKNEAALMMFSVADKIVMVWNTAVAGVVAAWLVAIDFVKRKWNDLLVWHEKTSRKVRTSLGIESEQDRQLNEAEAANEAAAENNKRLAREVLAEKEKYLRQADELEAQGEVKRAQRIREGIKDMEALVRGDNTDLEKSRVDFMDEFIKRMGADSPYKKELEAMKAESERIKKQMAAEREAKRRAKEEEKKPTPTKPPKTPEEAKKADASVQLAAGRYSFQSLGEKIQDSLLGKTNDKDKKMIAIGESGLKKQDELIKAVKDQMPQPGFLIGGNA